MGDLAGLDPRTPVLVGGGQAIDRLDAADYARLSAVGLAARAAHAALADCGADPQAVAGAIEVIAGVRQFETTTPFSRAPLGRADNYPRAVAARIGACPGRAILEVTGGQAPQHLVTELAGSIAAGAAEVALIVGSEAISTARHFAGADDRPDFTESVGGSLEDRGYGLAGLGSAHLRAHGLTDAPTQYALLENARSMHAIVETLHRARRDPGSYGFVGANGGIMGKYSAGVYTTRPSPWRPGASAALQASLDETPPVEVDRRPHGPGVIETFTVRHGRDGDRLGIVVGRLEGDGRRFVATVPPDEQDLIDLLGEGDPFGTAVYVQAFGSGNRVTRSRARMDSLFPPRSPGLRERYQHVVLRRDGHLLEVTINRPEAGNALHPPASDELDEVFDAYFADPDLWVAILTGAGEQSFCAGHDLAYAASGQKVWVPLNGLAGLTSRPRMTKPVIAAVNGLATGAGCEIALACHLVVADATASFGLTEVRAGQVAGAGGLVRLPRAIPEKVATELIVTGRRMDAAEAHRWGLVNRVTEAGAALAGARELAGEILAGSPSAVRASLQIMADTRGIADAVAAVHSAADAVEDLMVTDDALEGMKALADQRAPEWRNR